MLGVILLDKQSLSVFGWIIIVLVFIASVIALLPSFGTYLSNTLFESSGNLMNNAEVARPISVNIEKSYYGECKLLRNDYFEKEIVEFTAIGYPGYIYNGATITAEDGQTLTVDKNNNSFILGQKNVTIKPNFVGVSNSFDISENGDGASLLTIYENNTAVLTGHSKPSIVRVNDLDISNIDIIHISSSVTEIPEYLFKNFTALTKIVVESPPEKITIPLNSLPNGLDVNDIIYKY